MRKKIITLSFVILLAVLPILFLGCGFFSDKARETNSEDMPPDVHKVGWSSYKIDESKEIIYRGENSSVHELVVPSQKDFSSSYMLIDLSEVDMYDSDYILKGSVIGSRQVVSVPENAEPTFTDLFTIIDFAVSDILYSKSGNEDIKKTVSIGVAYTYYSYFNEFPLFDAGDEYIIAVTENDEYFWADSSSYVDFWSPYFYHLAIEKINNFYIVGEFFKERLEESVSVYDYFSFESTTDEALADEVNEKISHGAENYNILLGLRERCQGENRNLLKVLKTQYLIDVKIIEDAIIESNR